MTNELRHLPSQQNTAADPRGRGGSVTEGAFWWGRSEWLRPQCVVPKPSAYNQCRIPGRVQNCSRGDSRSNCGLATKRISPITWTAWCTKGPSSFGLDRTVHPYNSRQVLWTVETLDLWVRHSLQAKRQMIGDVVILREDKSNRGKWLIGMKVHLFDVHRWKSDANSAVIRSKS